jgi:hypothetical protein
MRSTRGSAEEDGTDTSGKLQKQKRTPAVRLFKLDGAVLHFD